MNLPRLLVLTDRSQLRLGRGLARTIEECVAAGLEAVVVREHDLEPPARRALVAHLAAIDGLFVISSRTSDPTADAVHLAAAQDPPTDGLFGRSCHTREEVGAAARAGASWALLSPYADGVTKPGRDPLPPSAWSGHPIPVFALGGVDPANAAAARERGAHGVAVMGAVMRSPDPSQVVAALLGALR